MNTIYTLGTSHTTFSTLISRIHTYGINCVVDIRNEQNHVCPPSLTCENLTTSLLAQGITYLSFYKEFGFIPANARNSRGVPVYTKVNKLDCFTSGITRLINGISKGFNILLLDSDSNLYTSFRFLFIGKALLQKGIIPRHILDNGTFYTQEEVTDILRRKALQTKENKEASATLGINGEEIAALHLSREGYRILDKNWNLHRGCELDLVARKDGVIHFIEVKTRSNINRGLPQEAIDSHKMHNIITAVKAYMHSHDYQDLPYQIDAIAIVYRSELDYDIQMLKDIAPIIRQ